MGDEMIELKNISFLDNSSEDPFGRIFLYQGRVLRVIWEEEVAQVYQKLLSESWINKLFDLGVVKTWICSDITVDGVALILEHERIPFITYPGEWTDKQFWEASVHLIHINLFLLNYGYSLKDSHPWNIQFSKGRPVFIDFFSIENAVRVIYGYDHDLYKYCLVPIWLASRKQTKRFALQYRKETNHGFGHALAESSAFRKLFFKSISIPHKRVASTIRYYESILKWMYQHKPVAPSGGNWLAYAQEADINMDFSSPPEDVKDAFVYEALKKQAPGTALDIAANKGFYSEMAVHFGYSVMAFDYEEACIDACREKVKVKGLNITTAIGDFRFPTPPADTALNIPDAFDRFASDTVLAMGLIHHVCLGQRLQVHDFTKMLLRYAKKSIIWEFVSPDDVHVSKWGVSIPRNYSLESIISLLSKQFPHHEIKHFETPEGVKRVFIHSYNEANT